MDKKGSTSNMGLSQIKYKVCSSCKKEQEVTEFPWQNDRTNRASNCKTCRKKYLPIPKKKNEIEKLIRENRTKQANNLRNCKKEKAIKILGGKCVLCKESYPYYVYDFHHINPKTKDVTPAKIFCRSWKKIEPDLPNFTLLCANCHRKVHHEKD